MHEILSYRKKMKIMTTQKIGKTSYFITSQFNGNQNILEKLGDIMAQDYQQASGTNSKTTKQSDDCA